MKKINPEVRSRIVSAAESLVAEGIEEPTNAEVLERMGKGSLSDVSPAMREWREARKADVATSLEMPLEMKKAIELALGNIWKTASKLAAAELDLHRREASDSVQKADAEREEALAEVRKLEAQIEALNTTIERLNRSVTGAGEELSKEQRRVAQLSTENAALAARVDDRNIQVCTLQDQLKEARLDNKALQRELLEIAKKSK